MQTDRLVLRLFQESDAPFILELLNERLFLRHIGDKGVRNLDDALTYLNSGPIASYTAHGYGIYHVALMDSGASIGMCGLVQREDQKYADLGYAFLQQYHGNGYAHESAVAVLDFGSQEKGLKPILAFVNPNNTRSIQLLERLNMAYAGLTSLDGISEEQLCYSTR